MHEQRDPAQRPALPEGHPLRELAEILDADTDRRPGWPVDGALEDLYLLGAERLHQLAIVCLDLLDPAELLAAASDIRRALERWHA